MRSDPLRVAALAALAVALSVVVIGTGDVPRGGAPIAEARLLPGMVRASVPSEGGGTLFVQAREVTVAEWNRCHDAGACGQRLRAPVGEPGDHPATNLNRFDVEQYVAFVRTDTGAPVRLPTMSEWKALAAPVLPARPKPILDDPDLRWASAYDAVGAPSRTLRPSGAWSATPDGVFDLNGNVWEWTEDCYRGSLTGAPPDAACPAYFVAGEHDAAISVFVRDPARGGCATGLPPAHLGLRLVIDGRPDTRT